MGLTSSALAFHQDLPKQQASFGPRLAAPDSLHGSLIILAVTDEELGDEVVADLGLLISRQHGPGSSVSSSKPRLGRFISVTLPRGVPAGGPPLLHRLRSESRAVANLRRGESDIEGTVKWRDRWTLPEAHLHCSKVSSPDGKWRPGSVYTGRLELRELAGLNTLIGEATALELKLSPKSRAFRSQAFPWSNTATMLLALHSEVALLDVYGRVVAALLDDYLERSVYEACFLHLSLASMVAPRLQGGSMALRLSEVVPEGGCFGALAGVVCIGQAILLEGPMESPPVRCWELLEKLLVRFPAVPPAARKEIPTKSAADDRSMDLMPGLQNWWLAEEERLPLSPVERLGFFDQSMAVAKCLAVAEAQSVVPRYRGHLLLPLLPFFYEAMPSLKWPALGGKKAGDVVLVSDACVARPSGAFAAALGGPPLLQRTATAMQVSWMEAAQSLRQVAGRLALHGDELQRSCQENLEMIKAMLPLSDELQTGILKDVEITLKGFTPKVEEWRANAQEAMAWLGKEDERQKEYLAQSRNLAGGDEAPTKSALLAAVQTVSCQLTEVGSSVQSMARAGPSSVVISLTGGLVMLDVATKLQPQWLMQGEPGFSEGRLGSAQLGERAVALANGMDGSILVADTSNHRIRRINLQLTHIETLAGTGAKGQKDGDQLSATFSSPVAVVDLNGVIVVLEEAHPGTVRVIEGGLVDSVSLPMGRHNMKEAAALSVDRAEGKAYIAHSGGVVRLCKMEGAWKAEQVLDMKGITGMTHLRNPENPDSFGLLLSRKDYRLSYWDSSASPKQSPAVVAGQAMSRGSVDGTGAEARFSAPGHQLVLSDGSLLVADGPKIRRLAMRALRQSELVRTAQTLHSSVQLCTQRAERLKAAWDEVLHTLAGPFTTVAATRHGLCEERFEDELTRAGPEATSNEAMLQMAPSLSTAEKVLRFSKMPRPCQAVQAKLSNYFWPPSRQLEALPFLHKDLEAMQRLVSGGALSLDAAVAAIDGAWFSRQVGFVPALVGLFDTLKSCFPERPMQLAMVRWALRRYVRSSFSKIAKELQDRGNDDVTTSNAFASWLCETLQPLDLELREHVHAGGGGLPWLLEDLVLEHLVGDGVEPRSWFLQQHHIVERFGPELRKSMVLALKRVATELPMRRVIEALGLAQEEQKAPSRLQGELLAMSLEMAMDALYRKGREGREGREREVREKEMELSDVLKLDLLSWARVLRWFDYSQEHLSEELQARVKKCMEQGKAGLDLLALASEKGTLPVTVVMALAGHDRRADGCDALETAGYPAASDALRSWHQRLIEATGVLQGLVEACRSLWPKDAKLLGSIARASEAWNELPASGALRSLNGEETGYFPQVPPALLRSSGALALLGKGSGAFKALWKQSEVDSFDEEQLRSMAVHWSEIYTSLEKPQESHLKLSALVPVLERLSSPAELRLMAVTGTSLGFDGSEGEGGFFWGAAAEWPAEWEASAEALVKKLWHSHSVKLALQGLKKTLASLQEKFLDHEEGQKDAETVLALLAQLEERFAQWDTTPLKDSEEITKSSEKIDARLLIHSEELMTAILEAFDLLQWLRKMPEDADYLVRVEIALGRSEMEVPVELWLSAEGRVDESKLSALTAVRTTLHDLIYRPKIRFPSLDAFFSSLSSLENSTEIAGLVTALNFAHSMMGPLQELLGGQDAALARMLQMLKPSSCARWVMAYPRLTGATEMEEEEEELAQIPAEARLLYLLLNDPGIEQKSAPQRLVEILDFQAAVTLAASTSDRAFGQVAIFNEQIGLVRLAVTVVDDLREAGHPDFQEFRSEWWLSTALAKMKLELNSLRERQGNWRRKLTELRQSHPVLGFFAARQLGALLRALLRDEGTAAMKVLDAVSRTWSWSSVSGWWEKLKHRLAPSATPEDSPTALNQDAQNLQNLADGLQELWASFGSSAVAPAVPAEPFDCGPGAQVVLAQDMQMATALVLWPFLSLKRRPRPEELLLCHDRSCSEQMQLLLLRWAHASQGFFCLLLPDHASFAAQQAIVQAVHDATDEAGPLPKPRCPLLLVVWGTHAAQAQVATQLMAHRVELRPPETQPFAEEVMSLISAQKWLSVHVGPHCGCGKTFSVRMTAKESSSYCCLKLTANMGVGKLSQELAQSVELAGSPGSSVSALHLDLSAGQELLNSDAFAVALVELLILGRLGRTAARDPSEIFQLDSRLRVAIELPAGLGVASADWAALPLLSWLPQVRCSSEARSFRADEASLRFGMGDAFASGRHDGVKDQQRANAYERLQYVCGALAVLKRLKGAFPLHFPAQQLSEMDGETCYELLVDAAKLSLRPSLWNLWAFVDVLYWQLKEVHHAESVANQACVPEEGVPDEKPLSEVQPQDCPIFKGELIAFILRTARDFATRQTKNNEVDPTSVVAADLLNFHQDRFCGRWRLQPFSSDGHPVFARYDCSEKGSGQFFLYYRAAQKMWTIDAEVDKVAPAFAYTRNSKYKQGWWRMASWVVNKQMLVVPVENALGFSGQAVQVRGVDEQLTGSPEEYLVALNGIYLRQPREDNVNGQAHYVLEKPRRHLFFDTGMDCWCIAHICHSDEGVYAKSCNKTLSSAYMTMGQDQKVPEATVNFITAQEEAMATNITRQNQEEGDFPLLRWEDSSHDCMLFSNRKHQVCFLSSQPSRLRISMHPGLLQLLERNRVSVGESLDALTADHTKVLGCLTGVDRTAAEAAQLLDGKYCLTGDAVLKMLAIFVRMRCGLPVILMGECGCGKTELVRYLCAWSKLPLLTLNVHGGTTEADMDQVFREARKMAEEAKEGLVVFLDEINTSQHVNMLCEAVLERSYRGRALPESVTVLAALNPRRKRPQAAMTTGLVYGSGAEEEMSSLVYRVHAVPETVNDFLFDFGALTKKAEEMYIRSMVQNCWPDSPDREQVLVTSILGLAQDFIRYHEGDPSAVSLRDVKRCLRVARWMQDRFAKKTSTSAGHPHPPSLVVAVALVYHYRLPSRERRHQLWVDLTRRSPWPPDSGVMRQRGWEQLRKQKEENGLTSMENLLLRVQANVAKEFEVEKDVVMNEALAENVFVGLLCIMNRIPLFIVGKPGTSKTLCMQVLLSNLQGKQSKSKVLQSLPALRIMQYQCSPLSTADGIQRQFDAAGRFASNALDAQVVLLLDEVGLAEFSPDMPLKVLHGILAEPGTVAVVGLSNWRLDPAKMNRSVCLARPDPDSAEVGRTGAGLLGSLGGRKEEDASWLQSLSGAFWGVFADQGARDWLGMRDYYSFVRAVRDGCLKHNTEQPNAEILCFAIQRNFGGQPLLLERMLQAMLPSGSPRHELRMKELLQSSLTDRKARHLLLASQGPALPWLQAAGVLPDSAEILLGSDFPEDASEAYAIRQLMCVRDAMAKGRSLVLCGMDVIYEALYDVLNQRYVRRRTEEGEIELMLRLAIGARSQLCPMAESFKLLVLVDQEQAFKQLDVPFLNRFEKQLLQPADLLPPERRPLLDSLRSWCRTCASEASCELVPGLELGGLGTLAALMLAKPEAELEDLQRAVFDMALPLAVFRSKTLQQMQRREEEYFEVRCSLSAAMRYAIDAWADPGGRGVLCELATSSPMAHMPSLKELAAVGGTEIIPVSQLSGSQQLEDILEKFFQVESETGPRSLILQVDALSASSRLALTRHCCSVARARQRNANAHVFLIQHRAGWTAERGASGFKWQPEVGWTSIFVDDIQGTASVQDPAFAGQSLKEFLQLSVHELQEKQRIPSLAQILQKRSSSCVARCVQPGVAVEFLARRLGDLRLALREVEGFGKAVEALAMMSLQQWGADASGLQLHVKLAMQEMRFGSLRKSVWLSIERLQLSALSHALRWMDSDFNLRHITAQSSPAAKRLWLSLVQSSMQSAPQVVAAALRPGAALQGPAPVPNFGRFGPLQCRCPFSNRILSQCASVVKNLEQRGGPGVVEPKRLHALSSKIFGEETMEAFAVFEATFPGSLLHDAVAMWAPIYPLLGFELMVKVYTLTCGKITSNPITSPLELVAAFESSKSLVQSVCSLLSLVEASFGEDESNAVSMSFLKDDVGLSLVEGIGTLEASAEWVERARPHMQVLMSMVSTNMDSALTLGSSWWQLRMKLEFQSALGEEVSMPKVTAEELLMPNWWRQSMERLRDSKSFAEEKVSLALCRGMEVLNDVLCLRGAEAALAKHGLAEAIWSLVMGQDLKRLGLQKLPQRCSKALLRWLHRDPVKKVLTNGTLQPQTLQMYMNFLEDVEELVREAQEGDVAKVESLKGSVEVLHAAARLRGTISNHAMSLVGLEQAEAAPAALATLFTRNKSAAIFATKVLRRLGGDQELCRLAWNKRGALPWFPLDPSRLPVLANDLPDPFVRLMPPDRSLERYMAICSACGQCASSPHLDAFKKVVDLECKNIQRHSAVVLSCIASRVLLNRQVAVPHGLEALRGWISESFVAESHNNKRSRQMMIDRMFSDALLPHLEDTSSEEIQDAPPRKFLEQLALMLCILLIDSQSSSWLEAVMTSPREAKKLFWPTMPESEEAAVIGAMGYVGWYTCPNGHPYSVGECTRPMQLGRCPVVGCGAAIGGESHVNVSGVKSVKQETLTRKSQPGFMTATSELLDQTIVNQFNRQLNMRGLKALRLVVYISLWVSLGGDQADVAASTVKPGAPNVRGAAEYLYSQICEAWKDLLQRTRLPSRELCAWLHLAILATPNLVVRKLNTEADRLKYEEEFQIATEKAMFNGMTGEARKSMDVGTDYTAAASAGFGADWKELCDGWDKSVYEQMETALPRVMWSGRAPIVLEDFEESFLARAENRVHYPLLNVVLKEKRRLGALKALPRLLAWHAVLFEAFDDYGITREDARQFTNRQVIDRLPEHRQGAAEGTLRGFCRAFNEAFPMVERLFECEANPFLLNGTVNLPGLMSEDTPVIFSLPYVAQAGETEAPSLCTVQLANVLQGAQNELVEALDTGDARADGLTVSAATAPEACEALLASLDLQTDLLPLLHEHRREMHGLDYDLESLEAALVRRLRGALRIQVQLRHVRFGGELKDSGRLAVLRQKLPQEALPFGMVEELRRELARHEEVEATRTLRTLLEDGIHLCLSLPFGDSAAAQRSLAELLSTSGESETKVLPAALKDAKLCHLQELYLDLVRSHEAGDPLAGVALAYQEPLDDELLAQLRAAAKDLKEWLPVLHDLLAEQLVVDRFPASSSLKDFLGFAAGEDPPDSFPEALELRHALNVHRSLAELE